MRENNIKRATELGLQTISGPPSRVLEEVFSFRYTSVLAASDYKYHLFNLEACRQLYDTGVQNKPISMQMKFLSVLCDTGDELDEQHVFYMTDAEAVLINQLRLPTDVHD